MKRFFKWLLFLAVVLVASVAILLYNPGLLMRPIERYLSNMAGYSINLEGGLEIDTGRLTELTATGVRISAPAGANRSELAGQTVQGRG